MSPRIIHFLLSGGNRKAQTKGIRYAHGNETHYRESVLIRSAAPKPPVWALCWQMRYALGAM
jgi:hypothetical protein